MPHTSSAIAATAPGEFEFATITIPDAGSWATELDATHTINMSDKMLSKAACALTQATGVDVVFDTVGNAQTHLEAFRRLDLTDTLALLRTRLPGCDVPLSMRALSRRGCALRSLPYGDYLPERGFTTLARLFEQSKLDLDGLVTETISFRRRASSKPLCGRRPNPNDKGPKWDRLHLPVRTRKDVDAAIRKLCSRAMLGSVIVQST